MDVFLQLTFSGLSNGMIYALDRETGDVVWNYLAQAGINGWPAVADNMIIVPAGVRTRPLGPPVLIAFRLGVD